MIMRRRCRAAAAPAEADSMKVLRSPTPVSERFEGLTAMDLEQMARAYRARVLRELLADAILWVARLRRAIHRFTIERRQPQA
jgi:hypothetical protein